MNRRWGVPLSRSRQPRAFTLIELLVVIAIIAVLISILLPALSAVRRQAAMTKCATQMRELGNAMLLYVNDNKGYLPSPRISTPWDVMGILYDKSTAEAPGKVIQENIKWWHFLGKYLTKGSIMGQATTPTDINQMKSAVFWCPSFEGFQDGGSLVNMVGGYNRNFVGYGMNWWLLNANEPTSQLNTNGFPSGARQVERFSDYTGNNTTGSGPVKGTWYKLVQYRQPAERAMLADGRQWYLEAKRVPPGQAIPGQRLNYSTNDYSTGTTGQRQTTFDFYRHGKFPPVQNPPDQLNGTYTADGGRVAYNILYADNHVAAATDRETGYRACRMKFPE
jgi:prepilin-type N-terminal cleavage/methylation domain-containing protein/prepilin-type processing-associated H-X9-DG protein